jgi:outer membrane protein insertion porin family
LGEALGSRGILASLNGAVVIDRRDSLFDAKRGWFGSASVRWGQRQFGSDLDYLRTLVRGSYYQPLGPLVVAGNLRWGRLAALGGVPPLTVFDLFFDAGGTESVRGYRHDELSAYEFLGVPLGGTKLLVANGEIRAPLFWRFGGVLFADAGNTFREEQAIRVGDLAVGLGLGLRINTPLAPIRIDLGFPVSRYPDETGPRWHFSIGQAF